MGGTRGEDAEAEDKLESITGEVSATEDTLNERGEKLDDLTEGPQQQV